MATVSQEQRFDASDYPWPCFEADEVAAVSGVLASGKVNYWTGLLGREFERRFAEVFGVRAAVAMANGTVTLQACVRALGIGHGDEVITTPRTFIGTSCAVVLEGAKPVFADVNRESGNIDVHSILKQITPKTRAILPVHLGGWPCDMPEMMALAKQHGLVVIEDCAQSHGAKIDGKQTGSFGDMSSWSFCQDKIMTTGGEGGMVGTNDFELWRRAWSMKDHGKSFDAAHAQNPPPGFRWVHESWGSNWRLTEMQSAIGLKQLEKLPTWTAIRTRNASILESRLRPLSAMRVPAVPETMRHAYYKLYVYIRPNALKSDWSRDRLLAAFSDAGVPGFSGSCPEIYLEGAFRASGLVPDQRLPVAKELGETSMMFQVHPTLSEDAMQRMADVVEVCVRNATR